MTDSTLLLPDSGPEFLRALNLAALYSEEVHVFTLTNPETAQMLGSMLRTFDTTIRAMEAASQMLGEGDDEEIGRARGYAVDTDYSDKAYEFLKFTEEDASLLSLAEREGVLTSITESALLKMQRNKENVRAIGELFTEILQAGKERSPDLIKSADVALGSFIDKSPPSLPFVLEKLFAFAAFYGATEGKISGEVSKQIEEKPELLLQPELLAFRHGIGELAADIDPSLDSKRLELELDTKIQKVFKAAIRDLRVSMSDLRLESTRRLLDPTKELGIATIPIVIALSAGAAPQTTATLGVIGGILAKLYEFTIGKAIAEKRILQASSWSILFRLEDTARKP